jgi:hypothetical protein
MKKILLSLTALIIWASAMGQNSADLKLNPEKNRSYRLNSVTEQTVVQSINGNQQTVESKTCYSISLKMVDATPDFIVAEIHIDTLSIKSNSMGKVSDMSSAVEGKVQSEETSDIMSYFMNRLSKNPVFAKIDFTGKTHEIVNSKMVAGMILKDTSLITLADPVGSALKSQITNMVSDDGLKSMIDGMTNYLPGKTVKTGEKWIVTTPTKSGGMSLDITTSYKLDGISGNIANITAESNIKASANAIPMKSGGATITYDNLKGLSKSTIIIDIPTGLTVKAESKTHISGNLGVTVPGTSLDIPLDINSNSRVWLIQ